MAALDVEVRQVIVEEGGVARFLELADVAQSVEVQRQAMEGLALLCLSERRDNDAREELLTAAAKERLSALALRKDAVLSFGVATVLYNATVHMSVDVDEEKEQLQRLKLATDPERTGERGAEAIERDMQALREEREQRELNTDAFRGRLLEAGYVPLLRHLAAVNTLGVHSLLADIVLALSMNAKHRGKLVQQGMLTLLSSLASKLGKDEEDARRQRAVFDHSDPSAAAEPLTALSIRRKAAQALAKIGVSTDPHLFSHAAANDMVMPLLDLVNGESELGQFEASLALTNLASLGPDIKLSIVRNRGWHQMEYLCSSTNTLVQRAATGALCNLVTAAPVLEAIEAHTDAGKRHVRLFLVLSQADDAETVRYASSALANLAGFPPAALLIAEGEGDGLKKLVRLLRLASAEIVHPAAHALAVLSSREGGTLVAGEWYPPADKAKAWSQSMLEQGVLPVLLLLRASLPDASQAHVLVEVLLENLNAWWQTPLTAAHAVSLGSDSHCPPQLKSWMTVLNEESESDQGGQ